MNKFQCWNPARRVSLLAVPGIAALLAGGMLAYGIASAQAVPAVQITPDHGPLAVTVTVVTGQNFAPHEQVAIFRGSRPFFAYETDTTGSFVGQPHPLFGPAPSSGVVTITAIGRTSGLKATTTFIVTN